MPSIKNVELHKKYFMIHVLTYINTILTGKLKPRTLFRRECEVRLGCTAGCYVCYGRNFSLTEDKVERLSQIIAEINSNIGKSYDNDGTVKAMLLRHPAQVRKAQNKRKE